VPAPYDDDRRDPVGPPADRRRLSAAWRAYLRAHRPGVDDYCLRANVSCACPVALIEVAEFVDMNCIFSDAAVSMVSVDG